MMSRALFTKPRTPVGLGVGKFDAIRPEFDGFDDGALSQFPLGYGKRGLNYVVVSPGSGTRATPCGPASGRREAG